MSPRWQLITSCERPPCLHAVLSPRTCLSLPANVLPSLSAGPLARWHCSQSLHLQDCHPQAQCLLLTPTGAVSRVTMGFQTPDSSTVIAALVCSII